jgi:hypothetical protein
LISLVRLIEGVAGQRPWVAGSIAAIGGVLLVRFPHLLKVLTDLLKAFMDDLSTKQENAEKNTAAQAHTSATSSRPRSKSRPTAPDEKGA